MASRATAIMAFLLLASFTGAFSQATNSRSDRITQALSAAHGAIEAAADNKATARSAALKGTNVALMVTRESADPWEFGRRLFGIRRLAQAATNSRSDRITQALAAAHGAIAEAADNKATARSAALKGATAAMMVTRESAAPWEFGKK